MVPARHYVHPVPVGSPMRCGVLAEIIESASPAYKTGDLVVNLLVKPLSLLSTCYSRSKKAQPSPQGRT